MEATKEKHAAFTPGPWITSCIEGIEDSLMVGGGDDGSDIVADIRTHENDILDEQAELYDHILAMLSRAHVHGDCTKKIEKLEKKTVEKLAELERKEKEARANARLIAAAPDLLSQCREFEKVLSMGDLSATHDGLNNCDKLAKLREVLAKVEGGEG